MLDAQLPGQWKNYETSITVTTGTQAKILVEENQPAILAVIAGEVVLPGEATVRQRILTGGQRIIDGGISSTDGVAKSILIWLGTILSRQVNMGVVSITGTNVINRTVGSFLTDGWRIGDTLMLFDDPTAANNGVAAQVTGVTAATLTLNGAPFANENPVNTLRVIRVSQRTRKGVPLNAGNTDAAPPVPLMGGVQDPTAFAAPDTGISLDKDSVIAVSAVAALSALPARLDCYAVGALY
jgi:hypothetical protein